MKAMEDWVVYRVFQKRRRPKKQEGVVSSQLSQRSIIDLVVEDSSDPGPPQPDSPSSSPTEFSIMGLDQEQGGSSGYTCFSSYSYMRKH